MTEGGTTGAIVRFSLPMMGGALLQQLYNVVDTLIVSHFIGRGGAGGGRLLLYADGLSHLRWCSDSAWGAASSFRCFFGAREPDALRRGIFNAFLFIAAVSFAIFLLAAGHISTAS